MVGEESGRDGEARVAGNGRQRELDELREVLLGADRERLTRVERRLESGGLDARALAAHLPRAIALREGDPELARALAPTVEESIQASVRRNPQPLVDAIFPIIGPAIRRAIQAALASMTDGLNAAMENSFTARGLRWRFEAWRTKRPFSEVVLLHSLVYRVEQVLWIENESGLLLCEASLPGLGTPDADLVSSMLTALQDYVGDSFAASGGARQSIGEIEFGEHRLVAVSAPRSTLAALVRGRVPASWREELTATLERLSLEAADELADFRGDGTPFRPWRGALEGLLAEQAAERKKGWFAQVVLGGLAVGVLFGALRWTVQRSNERRLWDAFLARLVDEPGVLAVGRRVESGQLIVDCLRDPDARTPQEIVAAAGVPAARVALRPRPFVSLEPEIVLARARRELAPPASVRVTLAEGRLGLAGEADHAWIRSAVQRAPTIAGVEALDREDLRDRDLEALERFVRRAEEASVTFDDAAPAVPSSRAWDDFVRALLELEAEARRRGVPRALDLVVAAETPLERLEGVQDALTRAGFGLYARLRPVRQPAAAADRVQARVVRPGEDAAASPGER